MYVNKWVVFSSAVMLELVSGLQYGFAVYSQALKEQHGLSQEQVEFVGTVTNGGNYLMGVVSGAVYDALARFPRAGPRITCAVSFCIALMTYPCLWMLASGRWDLGEDPATVTKYLAAFAFLCAFSGPFCDTTALAVSVQNFPRHRGQVVGQLKSFVGLSVSLHLLVFTTLGGVDPSSFILLQFCSVMMSTLLGMICQNVVPFKQADEVANPGGTDGKFRLTFYWGAGLAFYMAVSAMIPVDSPWVVHATAMGTMLVVFASLLLWTATSSGSLIVSREPLTEALHGDKEATDPAEFDFQLSEDQQASDRDSRGADSSEGGAEEALLRAALANEPALNLFGAWRTPEYWCLYVIVLVGCGSGLTFNNNLAQMVQAGGNDHPGAQNVFVSLYSISSCIARSAFGEVSQWGLSAYGVPRPAFLVVSTCLTAAGCIIASIGSIRLLYLGAVVNGLAFGSYWTLMPAVVSEIFGTRFFATIYSFNSTAPALGGLVLSTFLSSHFYFAMGRKHGDPEDSCRGPDCFRATFLILTGLSLGCSLLAVFLSVRTRRRYSAIQAWLRVSY